jgi:hypothetical protein
MPRRKDAMHRVSTTNRKHNRNRNRSNNNSGTGRNDNMKNSIDSNQMV